MNCHTFNIRKSSLSVSLLFSLIVFLIVIQAALPSVAFASVRLSGTNQANGFTFGNSQALDRASVSVVRLTVSYGRTASVATPTAGTTSPACSSLNVTGLGVLVGSWPSSAGSSDIVNWVLTDGSLVNPDSISCGAGKPMLQLSGIEIYASSAYSNSSSAFILKTLQCQPGSCGDGTNHGAVQCQVSSACEKGVVLLPFHTLKPQPFINVDTTPAATDQNTSQGIELSGSLTGSPTTQQVAQFLTPTPVSNSSDLRNELGMPIVNPSGQLFDMNTRNADTSQSIRDFVSTQLQPFQGTNTNTLHDAWERAVTEYYEAKLEVAKADFQQAQNANLQFQAPTAFLSLPGFKTTPSIGNPKPPTNSHSSGNTSDSSKGNVNVFGILVPKILLIIGGVILLVILLLLLSLVVVRRQIQRRRELAPFEEEQLAALQKIGTLMRRQIDRLREWASRREKQPVAAQKAATDAELIAEQKKFDQQREQQARQQQPSPIAKPILPMQAQRIQQAPQQQPPIVKPTPPSRSFPQQAPQQQPPPIVQQPPPVVKTSTVPAMPDVHCPNCHQSVLAGALFCANCGFALGPATTEQTKVTPLPESEPLPVPVGAVTAPISMQQVGEVGREMVQDDADEDEEVPNRVGEKLGNYQLVRLLGEGGFAEVYLGEHVHLDSYAAIKVLHSQLTSREREEFRLEAKTLVRLVHPHIVRVLDFGIEGKTPFLVMDYASHGTMRQRHPKGIRLPLRAIIPYVRQVADALQFAHEQRLIHRDVKPENILLRSDNDILLSDFGIATIARSSLSRSVLKMAGTLAYMAPEQVQGKPTIASDQYALGIVVYEWLCGERPFDGSPIEIATQHMMTPPPSLRQKVPILSPAVEQVVLKALAKEPKDRFSSVQAFAMALEQAR